MPLAHINGSSGLKKTAPIESKSRAISCLFDKIIYTPFVYSNRV